MKHNYFMLPGWFNMHEAYDQLLHHCSNNDNLLEIGCFVGKSTSYLATNIFNGNKNITIHVIDTFTGCDEPWYTKNLKIKKPYFDMFQENLQYFIDKKIVIPHMADSKSNDILSKFPDNYFQGIILDGAHTEVAVSRDIQNWWPKLKQGGTMIGDDYSYSEVSNAVNKAFKNVYSINEHEQWFAVTKGQQESKCKKLIPGQNVLNHS